VEENPQWQVNWTRNLSRLDRSFGRKRFGDEGYATEELVAELGATFLSAGLELTPAPRETTRPISALA
jgi:antirestriction protein ArdC